MITLSAFFFFYAYHAFLVLPIRVISLGGTEFDIGLVMSMAGISTLLVTPISGLLGDIYKDNRELLSNIIDKFYKLSLIDYEILSESLGIGFVLFSNRYSNDKQRYKTHIIVHKSLKDDSEDDIKILCLYEDLSGEISENSECKPISIKDILIHTLGELRKNREFNRIYNK